MAYHLAEDGQGSILALLHRNLRDSGEWAAVLIERCSISNNKDFRMIWNGKIGLNSNAARPVDSTSEPFSRRRRSNAGRPHYRLCLNALGPDHYAVSVDCLNRFSKTDIDTERH